MPQPAQLCGRHSPEPALQWRSGPGRAAGIPDITQHERGLKAWSRTELVELLSAGFLTPAYRAGDNRMVEIIQNTARLPMADREAIAEYVLTLNSVAEPSHPATDANTVESAHLAPQELTISIQLRQGWWEVRYHDPRPDRTFTTANEVHVPAGVRVAVELPSPNPASLVMDDLMEPPTPGTTRLTLRASRPGLYRGRCVGGDACPNRTMPLLVVAEKGEEFEAWREHQLRGAEPPATRAARERRPRCYQSP